MKLKYRFSAFGAGKGVLRRFSANLMAIPLISIALITVASGAVIQQFDFPNRAIDDPATLNSFMPKLAREVIAVYHDDDRARYLDNLFRLQIVAGQYEDATKTIAALRTLLQAKDASPQAGATGVQHEIFARARISQSQAGLPFDEAVRQSFREVFARLDDRTSAMVGLNANVPAMKQAFDAALQAQKGASSLSLANALAVIRAYQVHLSYSSLAPLATELVAEDDRRRYIIDKDIPVRTSDGATVCALVIRPRAASKPLPTLLNFTIYSDPARTQFEAKRSASNGYAAVEGFTRGKGCSPDLPVPIEYDGVDAAALIDWIAKQSWSDGRVGMYGGSYEGFTQWAAAKHMPKALKAIMPSVTFAPGIDFPMPGGVYQNYAYPWPFYTTNSKALDDDTYNNFERWNKLNHDWYVSGRAYRDLDKIDGTPNPIWDRWLAHPSYDSYWQSAIPYQQEFARINIPVLTTTGYYDDGQIGALYYFAQHYKYNPKAEHYLIIGPYDHIGGQRGTRTGPDGALAPLLGYKLDPIAAIDIGELRYQWFDYVFKGGQKPALLKDKVNYEVMGANVWQHAPSVAAMAAQMLRFNLSATQVGDTYRLLESKPNGGASIAQTVDFADRSNAEHANFAPANVDNWNGSELIVDKTLKTPNGFAFVSDPFTKPTEVSGLFSGQLDFVTNKRDFDFNIQLYESAPEGEYIQLSYYWSRASYVKDRSRRQLLIPDSRQRLNFESGLLTSRQFRSGSRLVAALTVIKRSDMQINYGTGKDVSEETIADAKEPLRIKWFGDSFIDLPVRQ